MLFITEEKAQICDYKAVLKIIKKFRRCRKSLIHANKRDKDGLVYLSTMLFFFRNAS